MKQQTCAKHDYKRKKLNFFSVQFKGIKGKTIKKKPF